MTWGVNQHLEPTRKEYIQGIQKMTGMNNVNIFKNMSKKELKQLREMIESARYRAVEEYKKGEKLYG